MRQCAFLLLVSSAASFAAVVDPYVEIIFAGSGNVSSPHSLGTETDPVSVSNSRHSSVSDPGTFDLFASASFSSLGVSSAQTGSFAPGQSRSRNAFAAMIDRLYVNSPGSSEATYRWRPTVRITGVVDWEHTGILDTSDKAVSWPVAIALAQYTRTESQTAFTRYSMPDIFPDKGVFDQVIELDEIVVPANEDFNYRLLIATVTKIRHASDGSVKVTSATADFAHTLEVIGLSVKDSAGNNIAFDVTSGSGALYSTSGITAVPEPSTLLLIAGSLLGSALFRRKR